MSSYETKEEGRGQKVLSLLHCLYARLRDLMYCNTYEVTYCPCAVFSRGINIVVFADVLCGMIQLMSERVPELFIVVGVSYEDK